MYVVGVCVEIFTSAYLIAYTDRIHATGDLLFNPDGPPPSGLPSADCSCGWGDEATMIDTVLDSVSHHLTEVGYV